MRGIAEILTAAAALPASLTYLELEQAEAAAVKDSACFSCLTNLRQLRMSGVSISSSTLAGLTTLQHLRLHLPDFANAPEPLAALPASLTYLELEQSKAAAVKNSVFVGWLTNLRQLRMSGMGISSSTLASLTTLQHLRLHLQEFADVPEASTGQLLTALRTLEQLQHLELEYAEAQADPGPELLSSSSSNILQGLSSSRSSLLPHHGRRIPAACCMYQLCQRSAS